MSESGSSHRFTAPNPERERDGRRLLVVMLCILVLGMGAFVALSVFFA